MEKRAFEKKEGYWRNRSVLEKKRKGIGKKKVIGEKKIFEKKRYWEKKVKEKMTALEKRCVLEKLVLDKKRMVFKHWYWKICVLEKEGYQKKVLGQKKMLEKGLGQKNVGKRAIGKTQKGIETNERFLENMRGLENKQGCWKIKNELAKKSIGKSCWEKKRSWKNLGKCKYHTSNDVFPQCKMCAQNNYRKKLW